MSDKGLRAHAIEALTTPGPDGFTEIEDDTRVTNAALAAGSFFDRIEPLIAERVRLAQEQAWNEGAKYAGYAGGLSSFEHAAVRAFNPYTQGDKQA